MHGQSWTEWVFETNKQTPQQTNKHPNKQTNKQTNDKNKNKKQNKTKQNSCFQDSHFVCVGEGRVVVMAVCGGGSVGVLMSLYGVSWVWECVCWGGCVFGGVGGWVSFGQVA